MNIRCHSVVLRRHVQVCDELLNNAERIRSSLLDMKVNYRYVCACLVQLRRASRVSKSTYSVKLRNSRNCFIFVRVRSVKGRGNTLQSECARLESEKKSISEFAQVMKGKLENFDELESITKKFQVGLSKVRLLHCLDLRATPTSFKILTFYLRNKICVYVY